MRVLRLHYLLVVIAIATVWQVTVAEVLEDSGYPMDGVNPQRNYQSNRPVLCSRAPGRSQVLTPIWRWKPTVVGTYLYIPDSIRVDGEGNVYVMVLDIADYQFVKLNGTDGSVIDTHNIAESTGYASPTLVAGNKYYFGTQGNTYILDTQTMTIPDPGIPNAQGANVPGLQLYYAPYLGTHMAATNQETAQAATTDSLTYIKVSDNTVDSTKFNVAAGAPLPVLIYKDNTNEIPIVVSYSGSNPNYIVRVNSPNYSVNITQGDVLLRAWIEGSSLFVLTRVASGKVRTIFELNALTGVVQNTVPLTSFQGSSTFIMQSALYAVNGKSVARIYNVVSVEQQIVDVLNDRVLLSGYDLHNVPVYSKPDNTMLMQVNILGERAELIGLDWDTFEINSRGAFPSDLAYSDITMGPPVIGNDCRVYTVLNGLLVAFEPLPVLEIVPIFECVNEDGVAYFSYENLGDIEAVIPQLIDRNNLSPLNVTPGVDFGANRRGKYFPLSFRVNFGTTGTFTWQLEDYVLTVTLNASLVCPTTVRFKILLAADEPFPFTFVDSVRLLFASLAGINETRVTKYEEPKRSALQATDLELELQVAPPGPQSTEPTAELAIQNFVNEQLQNFNNQLGGLPDAPANVTTKDVDGVPLATEIVGGKAPPVPPTAPLTAPAVPVTTPTAPKAPTPIAATSSSAVVTTSVAIVAFSLLICCLC